jgi:hypothetical protein
LSSGFNIRKHSRFRKRLADAHYFGGGVFYDVHVFKVLGLKDGI